MSEGGLHVYDDASRGTGVGNYGGRGRGGYDNETSRDVVRGRPSHRGRGRPQPSHHVSSPQVTRERLENRLRNRSPTPAEDEGQCKHDFYDCYLTAAGIGGSGTSVKIAFLPYDDAHFLEFKNSIFIKHWMQKQPKNKSADGKVTISIQIKLTGIGGESLKYGQGTNRDDAHNPLVAMSIATGGCGPCCFICGQGTAKDPEFDMKCKTNFENQTVMISQLDDDMQLYLVSFPRLGVKGLEDRPGMYGWLVRDKREFEHGQRFSLVKMVQQSLKHKQISLGFDLAKLLATPEAMGVMQDDCLAKIRSVRSPILQHFLDEERRPKHVKLSFILDEQALRPRGDHGAEVPEYYLSQLEQAGYSVLDHHWGLHISMVAHGQGPNSQVMSFPLTMQVQLPQDDAHDLDSFVECVKWVTVVTFQHITGKATEEAKNCLERPFGNKKSFGTGEVQSEFEKFVRQGRERNNLTAKPDPVLRDVRMDPDPLHRHEDPIGERMEEDVLPPVSNGAHSPRGPLREEAGRDKRQREEDIASPEETEFRHSFQDFTNMLCMFDAPPPHHPEGVPWEPRAQQIKIGLLDKFIAELHELRNNGGAPVHGGHHQHQPYPQHQHHQQPYPQPYHQPQAPLHHPQPQAYMQQPYAQPALPPHTGHNLQQLEYRPVPQTGGVFNDPIEVDPSDLDPHRIHDTLARLFPAFSPIAMVDFNYARVKLSTEDLEYIRNMNKNCSYGRNCLSNKARLEEIFQGVPNKDFGTVDSIPNDQCFYQFYCIQRVDNVAVGVGLGSQKKHAKQAASFITLKTLGFKTIDITT